MKTTPVKLAIVTGDFHQEISDAMIAAAKDEAAKGGIADPQVVTVPGSYEVPLVIDRLLADGADAAAALGFIEKGETLHGEVMGHVVHKTLVDLQLKHQKPIGLGIIGPGATPEQVQERVEPFARAAVRAALRQYGTLQELS